MPAIISLLNQLRADHPGITFAPAEDFKWSMANQTISFVLRDGEELFLLHELAHALLGHGDFQFDIELLARERAAWTLTEQDLAPRYEIEFSPTLADDALETYRQWLYERSVCPRCSQTGLQTKTSTYECINCRCSWRPNDARITALRRYTIG
jgi:hypothetical protein